jgi:glycyl-tRNA synthetase
MRTLPRLQQSPFSSLKSIALVTRTPFLSQRTTPSQNHITTKSHYYQRSRGFATTPVTWRFLAQNKSAAATMSHETLNLKGKPLDRAVLDGLLRRRMFYTPSYEIYGGVSGLYDYGKEPRSPIYFITYADF